MKLVKYMLTLNAKEAKYYFDSIFICDLLKMASDLKA